MKLSKSIHNLVRKKLAILLLTLIILQGIAFTIHPSSAQSQNFKIINIVVKSATGGPSIYPGSRRVSLKIETQYLNESEAEAVTGVLEVPPEIEFSAGSGACAPARMLNGTVALTVKKGDYVTFDYFLDVMKNATPGRYSLNISITYRIGTEILSELHTNLNITVSKYPPISLRLVNAYLSPTAYPGSRETNLYIILENNGNCTINSAEFNVTLPEEFTVSNPRATVGFVDVGDRFTLAFSGISISKDASLGVYNATLFADASASTEDAVRYNTTLSLRVSFEVTSPPVEEPFLISAINTLYQGSAAPLLPSAREVTIRVHLLNMLPNSISAIWVTPEFPENISVLSVSGTYLNGMGPGGTCYVDIIVEVNKTARHGIYNCKLYAEYLRIEDGSSYIANQTLEFQVFVESPHQYLPSIDLVDAHWGYPDPTPVYEMSRYVPLTLDFVNIGRYDAAAVRVNASSNFLIPVKDSDFCTVRLASGASCTAVLYFDINTSEPNVPLNVSLNYVFESFGAWLNVTRKFQLSLPVESYPAYDSMLYVVDCGWLNNYNVFPETSNATFQVKIANRAPYQISGIKLQLALPKGFSSKGKGIAEAYIEQTVRSLATFTAQFTVSVGNISPGHYSANLTVDYIMLSGGPGTRRIENFTIPITVNDDSSALEFIEATWLEGSVGPQTYGAHLTIIIRNNFIDSIKGATLEFNLPEGMLNAIDNSSYVKVSPIDLTQPLELPSLNEILGAYLGTLQMASQTYGRGDILVFVAKINLIDVTLGDHKIDGIISYIDEWGAPRKTPVSFSVPVLGRTEYVEVYMNRTVRIRSRFTNATLIIANRGSGPMYDVHIIIFPYQGYPTLMASPAVNHIQEIKAKEECEIPISLAYNPIGYYSAFGEGTTISYGPVPFTVSVIYRDAVGDSKAVNNSIVVVVEPFIDLVIKDLKAVGSNSSSSVTGIIINYGSATASRVEICVKIGNASKSSFIGDVESGSQVAFKVEVPAYNESAILQLSYYNALDELTIEEKPISIMYQAEETAPPPPEQGMPAIERWIIVAAVIVFLFVSALLIYKMMKKTRFGEMSQQS